MKRYQEYKIKKKIPSTFLICVLCVDVIMCVHFLYIYMYSFPGDSFCKELQCGETWVRSLGWEDPLEEGMALH